MSGEASPGDASTGRGVSASIGPMGAIGAVLGAALAVAVMLAGPAGTAEGPEISIARDLQDLGQRAGASGVPILLVVSQTDCPYCEELKAEILRPMLISGEYVDRVLIAELLIDEGERIRDFDGRPVESGEVAGRYDAWLTPTLLFLGNGGTELAPRIRGINTLELFGFYVDAAIDRAAAALSNAAR